MVLTLYGTHRSRTMRTLWATAELGLTYEHIPLGVDDPALKSAEFLARNPAGAIPTLVDDGFALGESLAINLYLAKRYGGGGRRPLYPTSPTVEATVWRWTLWAQGHLEPWVQNEADAAAVRAAAAVPVGALLRRAMATLDLALSRRRWLATDHFTIADLNVAAVLSPSRSGRVGLADFGHARRWLARCYARPAAREVRARFS